MNQRPKQVYHQFDEFYLNHDIVRRGFDIYVYKLREIHSLPTLYVDDIFMANSSKKEFGKFEDTLNEEFKMKYLGEIKMIIWIHIMKKLNRGELFVSQISYLKKVIERFGMLDAKTTNTQLDNHINLSVRRYA